MRLGTRFAAFVLTGLSVSAACWECRRSQNCPSSGAGIYLIKCGEYAASENSCCNNASMSNTSASCGPLEWSCTYINLETGAFAMDYACCDSCGGLCGVG
jgi:hypothetical protein